MYMEKNIGTEFKQKIKSSIEIILSKCDNFNVLERMLRPPTSVELMPHILDNMSKVFLYNYTYYVTCKSLV